jgi:hypothetical protein
MLIGWRNITEGDPEPDRFDVEEIRRAFPAICSSRPRPRPSARMRAWPGERPTQLNKNDGFRLNRPSYLLDNRSAVCNLTGLQRLQVNLARSERFGEQPPFVECPHDAIDFSLDFYGVMSLITIRINECRNILDYYYMVAHSRDKFRCPFSHLAPAQKAFARFHSISSAYHYGSSPSY